MVTPTRERFDAASESERQREAIRAELLSAYDAASGDQAQAALAERRREARTARQHQILDEVIEDGLAVWLENQRTPQHDAALRARLGGPGLEIERRGAHVIERTTVYPLSYEYLRAVHEAAGARWKRDGFEGLRLSEVLARVSLRVGRGRPPRTREDPLTAEATGWAKRHGLASVYSNLAAQVLQLPNHDKPEVGVARLISAVRERFVISFTHGGEVFSVPRRDRTSLTDAELRRVIHTHLALHSPPHRLVVALLAESWGVDEATIDNLISDLRASLARAEGEEVPPPPYFLPYVLPGQPAS